MGCGGSEEGEAPIQVQESFAAEWMPAITFSSFNFPDHSMRHCNFEGFLNPYEEGNFDFGFVIVAGLADPQKVSFRSLNFPTHFIRHQNFRVLVHEDDGSQLFKDDATFEFVRPNDESADWAANKQFFSFRSKNFPDRYLRHKNFELWLDENDGSDLFAADTTFSLKSLFGPVNFRSLNFPTHAMRHKNFEYFNDPAPPGHEGPAEDFEFELRPGNFNSQGLSFESVNFPGKFLRHQGFRCFLHDYEDEELFQLDSTFYLAPAPAGQYQGYFSLMSINFQEKALRHKNFEMWLEDRPGCGDSQGPQEDFCWRLKREY